jgi:hypothetical protein
MVEVVMWMGGRHPDPPLEAAGPVLLVHVIRRGVGVRPARLLVRVHGGAVQLRWRLRRRLLRPRPSRRGPGLLILMMHTLVCRWPGYLLGMITMTMWEVRLWKKIAQGG